MTDAENDMMQQLCDKLHEANMAYEGPYDLGVRGVRVIADDGRSALVCMWGGKWDVFFAGRYRMYFEREEGKRSINGPMLYAGLTSDQALLLLKGLGFDA